MGPAHHRGFGVFADIERELHERAAIASSQAPRVAVADFRAGGNDETLAELARALSEDSANGLSRFAYLQVASRAADGPAINEHVA